ncbi:hypothetical protein BJP36_43810 [Moorena producens JHB]|uniref:Uncharacterized protein n=1 Tax=Moorena producens (strain JHB) TaxID=1454205 RepID=A0A9Q9UVX6_MOOP1|nr:hypothetical protein [Moorena producens]WAN69288.1 hypothetical protein BJP36_43810 [Moorena producens JHB]
MIIFDSYGALSVMASNPSPSRVAPLPTPYSLLPTPYSLLPLLYVYSA